MNERIELIETVLKTIRSRSHIHSYNFKTVWEQFMLHEEKLGLPYEEVYQYWLRN